MTLTPGKARGLATTSTSDGVFTILALDHRDSLRVVLDADDPESVSATTLTETKVRLLTALGTEASGVMLEPEYSAAQAITRRALPGSVGFLAAVEAQGYLSDPEATGTTLMADWGVEKAKRLGASAIKLLVLYRPGTEAAEAQEAVIETVIADCARLDIPLFLEPLAVSHDPEEVARLAADRRTVVVDTVRRLGALGPEVLKIQFPASPDEDDRSAWADACAEVDETAPVPWALLSAGDAYERFRDQVEVACRNGASGFMAGRALWGEAVRASGDERDHVIETTVRPRLRELAEIARMHGRDWADRFTMPDIDETWYRGY